MIFRESDKNLERRLTSLFKDSRNGFARRLYDHPEGVLPGMGRDAIRLKRHKETLEEYESLVNSYPWMEQEFGDVKTVKEAYEIMNIKVQKKLEHFDRLAEASYTD